MSQSSWFLAADLKLGTTSFLKLLQYWAKNTKSCGILGKRPHPRGSLPAPRLLNTFVASLTCLFPMMLALGSSRASPLKTAESRHGSSAAAGFGCACHARTSPLNSETDACASSKNGHPHKGCSDIRLPTGAKDKSQSLTDQILRPSRCGFASAGYARTIRLYTTSIRIHRDASMRFLSNFKAQQAPTCVSDDIR